MLLRIAIGWHFLYEGLSKFEMGQMGGGKPFTAEPYLRNSTGPFASHFRAIIPDVNGLAKLDAARLKAGWADDVRKIGEHFGFDSTQKSSVETELKKAESDADIIFLDKDFLEDRNKYYHDLGEVQRIEGERNAVTFDRLRAADRRKSIDADRRKLVGELEAIGGALREAVAKLATETQNQVAGPYLGYIMTTQITIGSSTYTSPVAIPEWDSLRWINFLTMYGLMVMGFCLMAGLLTRPAALAGAVFLAQIYLSMPPWPGLPKAPGPEHFSIVDMHLIEMLACLFIATTRSGRWVGVDAFLFNWIGRRRARIREETHLEPDARPERRARTASQPRTY